MQHIAKRVFFRFFCGFSGPAATWQRRGLQGVVIAESQRETPGSITKCRIRTDHAANFTTVRHMHMALSLIRRAPGKDPLRPRRKATASHDDFLASLIVAQFFHPIPLCTPNQRVVDANNRQKLSGDEFGRLFWR